MGTGCYRFHLTAQEEYGLQWFAYPEQGSGYARIRKVGSSAVVKNFSADFGSELSYWFTMGAPLGLTSSTRETAQLDIYPNPTSFGGQVHVSLALATPQDVQLAVCDMAGRTVWMQHLAASTTLDLDIQLNGIGPGVYLLQAVTSEGILTRRLVVQ